MIHESRRYVAFRTLCTGLIGVGISLVVMEAALRLAPGLISGHLLVLFEPALRAQLAEGRFALARDTHQLPRTDAGPPLHLPLPHREMFSVDRGHQATEHTDELGFCNPPGSYRDRVDLIAIGDSFTFCHAVPAKQAWVHALGTATGRSVYNLGSGGKGLYEYLEILRAFGLSRQPRSVVLAIYGGNDLRDAVGFARYRDSVRSTGKPPPSDDPVAPLWLSHNLLGRYSYLLNLVSAFGVRGFHRASRSESTDFRYSVQLASGEVAFNVGNRDRDEVRLARQLRAGHVSLDVFDAGLLDFAALSLEHRFEGVVIYLPSAHAAYGKRTLFADPDVADAVPRMDRAQRAFFADRAGELGLRFIDLTPALARAAASSDELLYDPGHLHFTARGNEVVARALATQLDRL